MTEHGPGVDTGRMRTRPLPAPCSSIAVAGIVLFVAACGGGGDDAAGSADDTGAPTTEADLVDDGADDAADVGADGTAPGPTVDELTSIAASAEVAGFDADEPTTAALGDSVQRTYRGEGLEAHVTLAPCDPFSCWDLGGPIGPDHEENLRSNLAPVHLANPDLVFEFGTVEAVPGFEPFFTYSFSFVAEDGSKAATNSYRLLHHDDVTLFTVQVSPEMGFLPDTADEYLAEMDESTGAALAADVLAAYAGAFEPT